MLATQKDMIQLDDSLTRMRKNQADLTIKINELNANMESLNSQLESSQQRMANLGQKLDDLQSDLSRRMNVLAGQVTGTGSSSGGSSVTGNSSTPNPGDLFRLAMNDYQSGKYDLAIIGFRNLLSQFPKAELASQAQFQIAECEFGRKSYMDAAREYEKVVQFYGKSDTAPKALYKKGIALQSAGKKADAEESFRRFLKEYPKHELARSVKDLLRE